MAIDYHRIKLYMGTRLIIPCTISKLKFCHHDLHPLHRDISRDWAPGRSHDSGDRWVRKLK